MLYCAVDHCMLKGAVQVIVDFVVVVVVIINSF